MASSAVEVDWDSLFDDGKDKLATSANPNPFRVADVGGVAQRGCIATRDLPSGDHV